MNIVGDKQANEQALVAGPPTSLSSSLNYAALQNAVHSPLLLFVVNESECSFLTWIDKPPPCAAA